MRAFRLENPPRTDTHADRSFSGKYRAFSNGIRLHAAVKKINRIAQNWVVLRSHASRDPAATYRSLAHRHRGRPRRPVPGILPERKTAALSVRSSALKWRSRADSNADGIQVLVARIEHRRNSRKPAHTPPADPRSLAALSSARPFEPNPLAQPGLHPLPRYSPGCNDGLNARSSARSYDRST